MIMIKYLRQYRKRRIVNDHTAFGIIEILVIAAGIERTDERGIIKPVIIGYPSPAGRT